MATKYNSAPCMDQLEIDVQGIQPPSAMLHSSIVFAGLAGSVQ